MRFTLYKLRRVIHGFLYGIYEFLGVSSWKGGEDTINFNSSVLSMVQKPTLSFTSSSNTQLQKPTLAFTTSGNIEVNKFVLAFSGSAVTEA